MYAFNSAAIFLPGHPYIESTTVLSDYYRYAAQLYLKAPRPPYIRLVCLIEAPLVKFPHPAPLPPKSKVLRNVCHPKGNGKRNLMALVSVA